jgi:hypothetical protein
MLLYHGTSFENIESIRSKGILPPRETKKSNWSMPDSNDYESRKDAVYLSNTYALYYASLSSKGALVEIDIDSLKQDNLYPDEDFLAQSNLPCKIAETVEERTKYFKENLESYQSYLKDSLQEMGNCCYLDLIPPTAISRITTWYVNDVKILHWWNYDYFIIQNGIAILKDKDEVQLLRLLNRCFAKREFQINELNELLFLLEKKLDMNYALNHDFCNLLKRLHRNGYLDYEKPWKDALIEEMEKIDIVHDKDKGISIFN